MKKKILIIGGILLLSSLLIFKEDKNPKEVLVKDNIDIKGTIALYKSDDKTNYTEITEIPESGYIVNEDKSYCTTDNKTKVNGKIKTIDGNTVITNINKNDKCYVWFDKEIVADKILADIEVKSEKPDFSKIATTDEGVYAVSDGMYGGTSYYWRGAVTNNYVKFAEFCWRIVRINGDKSIRLIYDGTTCHANGTSTTDSIAVSGVKYNTNWGSTSYAGWTYTEGLQRTLGGTASNAKIQTDNWYNTNLSSYESTIADGKFCNDRNTSSSWSAYPSYTLHFGGSSRSGDEKVTLIGPSLGCSSGDTYTLKAGAITIDEVVMAGANKNSSNVSYYLYNGQSYWTMSPALWWSSNEDGSSINVFSVITGGFGYSYVFGVATSGGIRPVINLKSDVTFSSGNGTQNSPYIVE